MAQHDMNIANQGFPATRADINNALQALASNSSGTSAPSTIFANQWWYDTNNNKLYIRNEANNAWIQVAVLDQTNNEWQITTGQISASDGDGLVFKTDDGTTRITLSDGGDVTFADGTDIITASAGTDNVRLGAGAGDSIASGGDNNVTIGKDAGTAITTGDLNVAVGSNALKTISTHSNNTVVGAFALDAGTGASNVAVGSGAMGSSSYAADNNVAIGKDALTSNTTGSDGVAVGFEALLGNTTGGQNTAVGRKAMYTNTTGDNNAAFGFNAMFYNTTGADSVALGVNALQANTSGNFNTAVGRKALTANTVGNSNVAVGYQALGVNVNGSKCVAIGEIALRDMEASGGTSNDYYNTAVGYGAGAGITSGYYNTIMGGHSGNNVTTGISNVSIGYGNAFSAVDMNAELVFGTGVTGSGGSTITIGTGAGKISNTFTSNATWSQSSDERLKTNIQDDTLGLSFINRLNPVTYKWKPSPEIDKSLPYYKEENERNTDVTMHGLVAQQVKTALDAEGVDTFAGWAEGLDGVQTISREMFISPLIKAIKELSAEVETLKTKVAALEG